MIPIQVETGANVALKALPSRLLYLFISLLTSTSQLPVYLLDIVVAEAAGHHRHSLVTFLTVTYSPPAVDRRQAITL